MDLKNYFSQIASLINDNDEVIPKIRAVSAKISSKKVGSKIICIGNGGSAAISSHFSVDLTKNAGLRAINFNESDLITCLANDYGHNHWMEAALDLYCDKDDIVILISSSGKSKNILNAAEHCIKNKIDLITFSGMDNNNPLIKSNPNGINFWVNSSGYNIIENLHQIWLLSIVDTCIGNSEYTAKNKTYDNKNF
jgi:D-sedoheptulose 7-phosphate isomerase